MFRTWTVMLSFALLLSGCVKPEFCDVSNVIPFNSQSTIQYLSENDYRLLQGVVSHNRKYEKFCP